MKTILVPTDFSDNAESAITFAAELNEKIKGKIILFHSYLVPIPAYDAAFSISMIDDREIKESANVTLVKLKKTYEILFPGMLFETEVSEGIAENEIITEEKLLKCDLVVMGTRGKSGMREFFIGSNTASVIDKSICPVISVPDNAKFRGLKQITFATNFAIDDFKNIFDIIELARPFESQIELLHISTGDLTRTFEMEELKDLQQRVIKECQYPNISIKLVTEKNAFEGINYYLDEFNVDLLALCTRDKSFIQNYFSRSLTRKMVHHSHIPLMALHTT